MKGETIRRAATSGERELNKKPEGIEKSQTERNRVRGVTEETLTGH